MKYDIRVEEGEISLRRVDGSGGIPVSHLLQFAKFAKAIGAEDAIRTSRPENPDEIGWMKRKERR